MKVGLISRKDKKNAIELAKKVYKIIQNDFEVFVDPSILEYIPGKQISNKNDLDCVIVVGGDGTLLRVLKEYECPALGILYGRVGFLFEVCEETLDEKLEAFIQNKFHIIERSVLSINLNQTKLGEAVNETAIVTAKPSKLLNFEVFVDDVFAMKVWADGMIVATSVGSTSYAMSCGGPIIDPKSHVFVITPIAPFKLSARPLVISNKSKVTIKTEDKKAVITCDGKTLGNVEPGEIIEIKKAEKTAKFIQFDPETFYKNLSKLIEPT